MLDEQTSGTFILTCQHPSKHDKSSGGSKHKERVLWNFTDVVNGSSKARVNVQYEWENPNTLTQDNEPKDERVEPRCVQHADPERLE